MMSAHAVVRAVPDVERRARLAIRHALAASARGASPEDAVRAVVSLHATEPASVYLSCWARTEKVSITDVDLALYTRRSLIRQQAMRETLFVFPRDLLPAAWGSVAARFAAISSKRLVKDVERWSFVPAGAGAAWLHDAEVAVLEHLDDAEPRSARQLREEVPEIGGYMVHSPDKSWGGKVAVAPRVLAGLHMAGKVARAHNAGPWYTSHPTWTTTARWWGTELPHEMSAHEGYTELVNRWLWSYGPGTVEDIAWWLGATKTAVRAALEDLGAVRVLLDDGALGWLHHDDLDVVVAPEPWVALLPLMDPTVMGWKQRNFFLGEHGSSLFDSIWNAGTTVWVNGRVVGAWIQDPDGVVQLRLLETVSRAAHKALQAEARKLTAWLEGQRAFTVYPSPAMQRGAAVE